ncbi:hypothetical protein M885DRAFT_614358 [Pelagophyceae sp. CCMP2097]|nr:hypothetical protein M885DRAFT_614358 [Pelagophyceae sp. CCMP2097]
MPDAVRLYRACLGVVVALTVLERWAVLCVYYTDDGVLPIYAWREETYAEQAALRWICVHGWSGGLAWQRVLSVAQLGFALLLVLDRHARAAAAASLWLYVSCTLRHPQVAYILDRYLHFELLFAACAGGDAATLLLWRLQLVWVYFDAGWAKVHSVGWSSQAPGLPALDAYMRHTPAALLLRKYLLSDALLRRATPLVPLVELAAPLAAQALALLRRVFGGGVLRSLEAACVAVVVSLHVGIGLTMNGSALLSLAAAVAWVPTLHFPQKAKAPEALWGRLVRFSALGGVGCLAVHFELFSASCTEAKSSPLRALVHNRWNVFAGSDDHVVWEMMPARLEDGSTLDLWSHAAVSWEMPPRAARGGRWRSFPMVSAADASEEELERIYSYFCDEDPTLHVSHFHVYMLMADLEDPTRRNKKLLRIQNCTASHRAS